MNAKPRQPGDLVSDGYDHAAILTGIDTGACTHCGDSNCFEVRS